MSLFANLSNWFSGGIRYRELQETRDLWNETEGLWRASPLASQHVSELGLGLVKEARDRAEREPAIRILVALAEATDNLLDLEDIGPIEANWPVIDTDVTIAVFFRKMLARRRRWAADFPGLYGVVERQLQSAFEALFASLPESCLRGRDEGAPSFEVPLVELLENPAEVIERFLLFAYDDDTMRLEIFLRLREAYVTNLLTASGLPPTANPNENNHRMVMPTRQKGKSPGELLDLYLYGTPFRPLFDLLVPFHIPEEVRFEHCHIVGGTGHGKTQLMQRMIHGDLIAAGEERRSVVVIDSQGDLINRLVRLELFGPDGPLADRLIVIDPADVEFPAALNLFDAHLERLEGYRPVDRERVVNGVVELYETFFGDLLGAELTQKQGVIFKYLARLMLTIPGATIHTLMQLMEDGKPFKRYMDALEGSARYFFESEFFHPSFSATKRQILKRLWGVLSTPAFERMFAQKENKLDLFEALQDGKIILVNTAKDVLKSEGSQLFGRFFISMLAQAALERSTVDPDERTPTMVYVDEAQEYFDDSIETILNQARKYRVGITLAHQALDQLSPRLRAALLANTSMKCVGGVSARDARALADELRTTPDFIDGMRRRPGRSEFAVWIKNQTPQAIRLSVPLGFIEGQPLLTEEAYAALIDANRSRYCGTLAEVLQSRPAFTAPVDEPSASPHDLGPPKRDTSRATPVDDVAQRPSQPIPEPQVREDAKPTKPRPRPAPPEPGKGGSQHRYVQHLIKTLAEERGFRAMIEEAVDGGQVDVGLHRDDLSIACEISVTSTVEYEAQNLAKCLRAGFTRVWAVATDAKRRKAIQKAAQARLGEEEAAKVDFLTTDEMVQLLDGLADPEPQETTVRGYKVKTTRRVLAPQEARDQRDAITRILVGSMRDPTDQH